MPEQRTVRFVRLGPEEARERDAVQVADDEVAKRYEDRRDEYVDDEGNEKPFEEVVDQVRDDIFRHRGRVWASTKSSQLTADLITDRGEPVADFEAVARAHDLEPVTSSPFEVGTVPEELPDAPGLAAEIGDLTPEAPYSVPILIGDDYYILAYGDTIPSRPAELEEVREEVVAELRSKKARDAARAEAEVARAAIQTARAEGASCSEAFAGAGVEYDEPEPFSRRNPPTDTDLSPLTIGAEVDALEAGQLSEVIEDPDGFGLVCLQAKTPPSEESFEADRELFRGDYLMYKRRLVLEDYGRYLQTLAGLKKNPGFGGDVPDDPTDS
jgi:hypothetical protein